MVEMDRNFWARAALISCLLAIFQQNYGLKIRSGTLLRHSGRSPLSALPVVADSAEAPGVAHKIVAVVPADQDSPYGGRYKATWQDVFSHVSDKLRWINATYQMSVFSDAELLEEGGGGFKKFEAEARGADVFVGASLQRGDVASVLERTILEVPTRAIFNSTASVQSLSLMGSYRPGGGPLAELLGLVGGARADRELYRDCGMYWDRASSDDLQYALLLLLHRYVAPVPLVSGGLGSDAGTVDCMMNKCKAEVVGCVTDATCRTALVTLARGQANDQVAAYRAIVSYESPLFEQFSLCVLQKNNCMGRSAKIQMEPDTAPLAKWRGQPLSPQLAEEIFIGHLGPQPWSWKVAAGQNPAYDFFPCQHQIFYRAKARGNLWYDPVFKVETLDGREVWRRRHYKVRPAEPGQRPGTYYFSVLDNGVTSMEFWRIVDCADDLSYAVLAYQGAAAAAGTSYGGSLLCTPDGEWPSPELMPRVEAAFARAGIKMWELYPVNNKLDSSDAPLGMPEEYLPFNDFARNRVWDREQFPL